MNNDALTKGEMELLLSALSNPNIDMDINTRSGLESYVNSFSDSLSSSDFKMTEEDKKMYSARDAVIIGKNTYEGFYYKNGEVSKITLEGVDMNKKIYLFSQHSLNRMMRTIPFNIPLEEVEKVFGTKIM